jgi:hypothetical protein
VSTSNAVLEAGGELVRRGNELRGNELRGNSRQMESWCDEPIPQEEKNKCCITGCHEAENKKQQSF